MSTMNVNDIEEGLRRLLAVKSGDAEPTRLERVQLNSPDNWDDDDWEFANQRGLVPADKQTEYQRRVIERRHQSELAALQGTDLPANFTGNNPVTGTATVSAPVAQPDPMERLNQLRLQEERLRMEREALESSVGSASGSEDAESGYRKRTVPQLQEEISRRNADREEDDAIVPDSQRKDDLVAALVEDDEYQAGKVEQPE